MEWLHSAESAGVRSLLLVCIFHHAAAAAAAPELRYIGGSLSWDAFRDQSTYVSRFADILSAVIGISACMAK